MYRWVSLIHHVWAAAIILFDDEAFVRHHWVWMYADGKKEMVRKRRTTKDTNDACLIHHHQRTNDCSNNTSSQTTARLKCGWENVREEFWYGYTQARLLALSTETSFFHFADHTGCCRSLLPFLSSLLRRLFPIARRGEKARQPNALCH